MRNRQRDDAAWAHELDLAGEDLACTARGPGDGRSDIFRRDLGTRQDRQVMDAC